MVDPIADLLTRIRNAGMARHASTRAPYSKIKSKILEIMKDEGYIDSFELDNKDGVKRELVITLRYVDDANTSIHTMRRVSKPGRRVYCRSKDIPKIKNGLGTAFISTSRGVMTDREARKLNLGGEIICEIW